LQFFFGDQSLMPVVSVAIHSSQFPENVRRDLLLSLRQRKVNHKLLYDSIKQTQKWLALHEAHSPARNDKDCARIYDEAFKAIAANTKARQVHVIGLGCGGGQKDARLLQLLKARGKKLRYTSVDVSSAMVLVAEQRARRIIGPENCLPFVCDLATARDLPDNLVTHQPSLVTFFGMIPNFEPNKILPRLSALLRPNDILLFSANLAPGTDYDKGMQKILPQYDNALTREWLVTFLLDLGIERKDGDLNFSIENRGKLKRIAAYFHFRRPRRVRIDNNTFTFRRGENIRLFFSYRYRPENVRSVLQRSGLGVGTEWISPSKEEGVFYVSKR
jgi:L-histidine Nalpha-methyltransferase